MSNLLGIDTLVFIQSLLFSIWLLFSLIQGYALYDGNPGPSTVSNIALWAVIQFIVLQLGARATGFKLNLSSDMTILELSISNTRKFLVFYIVMLCIAVVALIIQAALLIAQMVSGSGTLATTNPVFGWVFLGVLVCMMVINVFLAVRAAIYRANVSMANALDQTGLLFALGRDKQSPATSQQPPDEEEPTAAKVGVPILDRINKSRRRIKA
jgi:hypothetical protein